MVLGKLVSTLLLCRLPMTAIEGGMTDKSGTFSICEPRGDNAKMPLLG